MNNLYSLGTNGMTNQVTLGTTAIDSIVNVGCQRMTAMNQTNEVWLSYLNRRYLIMQYLLMATGCGISTVSNDKVVVTCN